MDRELNTKNQNKRNNMKKKLNIKYIRNILKKNHT